MNKYLKNFQNLSTRDRWATLLGVFFLFSYLIYLFIFTPFSDALENQREKLAQQEETLIWMESLPKSTATTEKKQVLQGSEMLASIANTLKNDTINIYPYQLQQTHNNEVLLSFQAVPFNIFLNWLYRFNTRYEFIIKELNVDKSRSPGVVKLSAVLTTSS